MLLSGRMDFFFFGGGGRALSAGKLLCVSGSAR